MISHIIRYRFVPRVGKYIVALGMIDEKAWNVWMTEKQLDQIERCFAATAKGYSTNRLYVEPVLNERGYYLYAKLVSEPFVPPVQHNLDDLKDDIP